MKNKQTVEEDKWVTDNISVDHKGRVPLRKSTGGWRASFFLVVIAFCESFCVYGITESISTFLIEVVHEDAQSYNNSIYVWRGVIIIMPVVAGFVADAWLGQFATILLASLAYLLGLILLTMARTIPALMPTLKPCKDQTNCPQQGLGNLFLLALILILLGFSMVGPTLQSFGADQFDDTNPSERKKRSSFFNWWNVGSYSGVLFGITMIVYTQKHAGWFVADLTVLLVIAATIVILCMGRPFYRFREMKRNPITPVFQVIVAAFLKRKLPFQSVVLPEKYLYEGPTSRTSKQRLLSHTDNYKFLDKAAIIEDIHNSAKEQSPWRLSSVTKVEEVKLIISMILIWLVGVPVSMCVAQTWSLATMTGPKLKPFVYQGINMPQLSLDSFNVFGAIISLIFYDKVVVPILRRKTGKESGISILQRVGIGMSISLAGAILSAFVERERLNLVERNPVTGSTNMSVLWLAPQYIVMGMGDAMTTTGLQEFFYSQAPDSMRSSGVAFYYSLFGVGQSFNSFMFSLLVDFITKACKVSHITHCINLGSRFDLYYWLIAGTFATIICVFVIVAKRCSYKDVMRKDVAVSDRDVEGLVFF